jgi:8-oxo-dGTP diphosphatase
LTKQVFTPSRELTRPIVSVDVTIFTVAEDALQVLLVQRPLRVEEPFPGQWALPGGFVDVNRDPDLQSCALRKLRDKTGFAIAYLEQLGSWGSSKRDPRGWSTTHVYFALIPHQPIVPSASGNSPDTRWTPVPQVDVRVHLAFDHAEILAAAVSRLRSKVEYTSLPAFALPREFTLTDLQRAYEIVLGRPLEKSAFRTRVLAADLVEPVHKTRQGPNRPAQMYRLKNPRRPVFFTRTFSPR